MGVKGESDTFFGDPKYKALKADHIFFSYSCLFFFWDLRISAYMPSLLSRLANGWSNLYQVIKGVILFISLLNILWEWKVCHCYYQLIKKDYIIKDKYICKYSEKKSHFDLTLTAPSQNRTLCLSGAALGKSPGRWL